jgi:hypothetical protein
MRGKCLICDLSIRLLEACMGSAGMGYPEPNLFHYASDNLLDVLSTINTYNKYLHLKKVI